MSNNQRLCHKETDRKAAETYERQEELLFLGYRKKAACYRKIQPVWWNITGAQEKIFAHHGDTNAEKEEVRVYSKQVEIYEQQVEALMSGDIEKAMRYGKAAKVLGGYRKNERSYDNDTGAAWAWEKAREPEKWLKENLGLKGGMFWTKEGHDKRVEHESRMLKLYQKYAEAYEQESEALVQNDEIAVVLHQARAQVLNSADAAYHKANIMNTPAEEAAAYCKTAKAYEQEDEALLRNDPMAVALHKQRAKILEQAANSYAIAKAKKQPVYQKQAKAYEQLAEFLAQGNEEKVSCYKKIVTLLESAVSAYETAAKEKSQQFKTDSSGYNYEECAQRYEQQAELLLRGDQEI